MNIHFFDHNSSAAAEWPFYQHVRQHLEPLQVTVFADSVDLRYRRRLWLVIFGWPRLVLSAFLLAWRSVRCASPATMIVVDDHLQIVPVVLFYGIRRVCLQKQLPKIVYLGFIYTPRANRSARKLRWLYFKGVLSCLDAVLVYSRREKQTYETLFGRSKRRFECVHYGLGEHNSIKQYVNARVELAVAAKDQNRTSSDNQPFIIVSGGRSSRDYPTLTHSIERLGFDVDCRIVCDSHECFPPSLESRRVKVLRNCHGENYSRELTKASIVVLPLVNPEISAGQMVAMHALAAGKPVVITSTPVTKEYFEDVSMVWFVEPNDVAAMIAAIKEVRSLMLREPNTVFTEARQAFEDHFAIDRYAERVCRALYQALDPGCKANRSLD